MCIFTNFFYHLYSIMGVGGLNNVILLNGRVGTYNTPLFLDGVNSLESDRTYMINLPNRLDVDTNDEPSVDEMKIVHIDSIKINTKVDPFSGVQPREIDAIIIEYGQLPLLPGSQLQFLFDEEKLRTESNGEDLQVEISYFVSERNGDDLPS